VSLLSRSLLKFIAALQGDTAIAQTGPTLPDLQAQLVLPVIQLEHMLGQKFLWNSATVTNAANAATLAILMVTEDGWYDVIAHCMTLQANAASRSAAFRVRDEQPGTLLALDYNFVVADTFRAIPPMRIFLKNGWSVLWVATTPWGAAEALTAVVALIKRNEQP
jgi:hypothetical protein